MKKISNYKLNPDTEWLDCVCLHLGEQFQPNFNGQNKNIEEQYEKYKKNNPDSVKHSIWYDKKNNLCFSDAQYKDRTSFYIRPLDKKEHNFVSSEKRFFNSRWGISQVKEAIGGCSILKKQKLFSDKYNFISIHYESHESPKRYKGKDILIVGAGPSTNLVNWQNLEYDYIFSCNKFYNNQIFAEKPVDLIFIAADQESNENEDLHRYMEEHNSNVCFDTEIGNNPVNRKSMHKFSEKHGERCSLFNTRYRGAIGMGAKMILYALFMGAKNIYFVGLDGNTVNGPMHSFEENKIAPPWCLQEDSQDIQRRFFVIFWQYLLSLKKLGYEHELYNLGEGTEHNVSTDISKKCCPLPKHIKERILI